MEKTLTFCIDHFSFATPKRMEAANVLKGLGFVTGDTSVDRSTHFIFDNTLAEVCYRKEGEPAVWQGNSIEVGKMPRVHSYRMSNRGLDANTARDALLKAGIQGIGKINDPSSQRVKYGLKQGTGRYQTFFIVGMEPFTDILFGVTTQLAKDLIVNNPTKYLHTNGVKRVAELVFYCKNEEIFKTAVDAIEKLNAAMDPVTDKAANLNQVRLLDKESYIAEFGTEPEEDHHFPVVAVKYSGADLEYVKEAAHDIGVEYFEKNGLVYCDTRFAVGTYSIFEA